MFPMIDHSNTTMTSSLVCLIFTFLVVLIGADNNEDTAVINAPSGPIKGLRLNYHKTGEPLYEFRGIPFAKPPIGPLRFKKTEPLEKRKEVHDGTKFGNICMQPGIDFIPEISRPAMSEDCLVLNVYVPRKLHERLSVMVWIHGGGFWIGYGHQYDGGKLAMEGNVIIVTINYRLGAFGLFAVGDSAARGNYGLWDQKMALQWVHDNIASFGGNPESVTVFGESAGGCSASFQSLIPSNKGLFQRVIAQSSVVSRFVVLKDSSVEKFAAEIAEKSSCPFDEKQIFVDCLREKTADEILKLTDVFASMPADKMMFESLGMPVVDRELFLEHPIKSLEDKSSDVSQFFRSLDFMAGATSNEGSTLYMMLPPSFQEHYDFNVTEGIPLKAVCDGILSPFVELFYANNSKVKDKLCKYYSAESVVDQSLKATDAWADIIFNFAINKMLEYHSGGNTYQYVVSKLSPKPFGGLPPSWFKGVGHGDELLYFFNITQFLSLDEEEILNDKDEDFGKKLISYWTSFAKTGLSPSFQEHYDFNVTEGIPLKAVCDGILSPFVDLWYSNNSKVKDKLCKYYSAESIIDQSLKATDAWGDITFDFAINKMLEYHSGGNTYQYAVSKLSPKPFGGAPPTWFKGVGHGDELLYFFNIIKFLSLDEEVILNDKDEDFGKKMLSYWTSFAKTGVPYAGDGSVPWKPFDIEYKNYLDLDDEITQKRNFKPEILDLWSNQLPASDLESATPDNGQRDEL